MSGPVALDCAWPGSAHALGVLGLWTWDVALAAGILVLCVLVMLAVLVWWAREIWRQRRRR